MPLAHLGKRDLLSTTGDPSQFNRPKKSLESPSFRHIHQLSSTSGWGPRHRRGRRSPRRLCPRPSARLRSLLSASITSVLSYQFFSTSNFNILSWVVIQFDFFTINFFGCCYSIQPAFLRAGSAQRTCSSMAHTCTIARDGGAVVFPFCEIACVVFPFCDIGH